MDLIEYLDAFVEEAVAELYTPEEATFLLLNESFKFTQLGEPVHLLTEMKRIRVKVAGGGYMTKRKIGRKDPRRSMIAKRSARKGRAKRMAAMRNPRSKMKRRRTMAARSRLLGASKHKAYRGFHGAKRHAAPRRQAHPRIRRVRRR